MLVLILAYLGGALTILSPCILPVLPFVFARSDRPFMRNGFPMLLGMAITFAAVATLAALGGGWAVHANQYERYVAMVVLAFLGLTLLSTHLAEWISRPFVALGNRLSQHSASDGDSIWGASPATSGRSTDAGSSARKKPRWKRPAVPSSTGSAAAICIWFSARAPTASRSAFASRSTASRLAPTPAWTPMPKVTARWIHSVCINLSVSPMAVASDCSRSNFWIRVCRATPSHSADQRLAGAHLAP
jgi:cytochrome c biogenesis protein CcdA